MQNAENKKIYNKVRAFNPEPTAYVMLKEENIKIYEIEKIDREYEGVLGEVVELTKKGPIIKCGRGAIKLLKVKIQGKKVQTGADLVNGRKILLGDVLNG